MTAFQFCNILIPRSDSMGPSLKYRWGKSFRSKFRRSSDAPAASPGSGVSWASKRQLWLRRDSSQSLFNVDGEGQFYQLFAGQYWKVSQIRIFTLILMWILVFRKHYRQVTQQPEHKSRQKRRILHWYRGVSVSFSYVFLTPPHITYFTTILCQLVIVLLTFYNRYK